MFNPENSKTIIIRCYIQSSLFKISKTVKTGEDTIQFMIKYINKLSETIMRGISNIIAAVVSEYTKTLILDD